MVFVNPGFPLAVTPGLTGYGNAVLWPAWSVDNTQMAIRIGSHLALGFSDSRLTASTIHPE